MPITTYLQKHETLNVDDEFILETLKELNEKTDNGWVIHGTEDCGLFKAKKYYELLYRLRDNEYQVIDFHGEYVGYASAETLMAYMIGYLAGMERSKNPHMFTEPMC